MVTSSTQKLDIPCWRDYNVTMTGKMKLRKIGNSLGTTFSRELLQKAGLTGDEELEVITAHGEITLRKRSGVPVEFSEAEAQALASGEYDTEAGQSALDKVRKAVE